jgi:hypothetical protein
MRRGFQSRRSRGRVRGSASGEVPRIEEAPAAPDRQASPRLTPRKADPERMDSALAAPRPSRGARSWRFCPALLRGAAKWSTLPATDTTGRCIPEEFNAAAGDRTRRRRFSSPEIRPGKRRTGVRQIHSCPAEAQKTRVSHVPRSDPLPDRISMTPRDPREPDHEPADAADDFDRVVRKIVAPLLPPTDEDEETEDAPPVPRPRRILRILGAVSTVLVLIVAIAWRYEGGAGGTPPTTQAQPRGLVSSTPPPPTVAYEPRRVSPSDTTAICRDRTASFSQHSSGTCSGHDGVLCWIHHPGRNPPTTAPFCTTSVQQPQGDR